MLDGDTARAEDINSLALSFDRILSQKVEEMRDAYNHELKRLWGTVVTIFGLFLALFSLVNVAVKPIYFSSELQLTGKEIMLQSLLNITPLACVLALFVVFLYIIFKR